MKKFIITLLLICLSAPLCAQDIWVEGTTWEVEYTSESELPHTVFTLMSPVEIEGVSYYPLTSTTETVCDTVAFIRSERGDSLVYARVFDIFDEEQLLQETLLYDFTKSFEPGNRVRYGTYEGPFTEYIGYEEGVIDYLYDVLEEGDCLPIWNGIIYMISHVEGPLGMFFQPAIESGEKPKPTNVSHILFGTRKGGTKTLYVASGTNVIVSTTATDVTMIYDLQGRRLSHMPRRGLYIIRGKLVQLP